MSPSQSSLNSLREQIASRLAVVRRALLGHFLAEGVARTLVVTVGLLLLSLGLDWWLDLSLTARLIYWGVVLASAAGVLFWFVVRPWRLPLGPIDVAAALDQKRHGPPLAPQVASVIQLVDSNPDQIGESEAMRETAVRASHAALEQIDFRTALNSKHLWTAIAVALGTLLLPAGIALAFPSTAKLWAERWFSGSDRPWPRSTRISVEGVKDGVLQVPRGEVFTVQAKVTDDKAPTQTVWLRQRPTEGKTQTYTLEKFSDGDFRLQLAPQQQPSRVEVWGGDGRAEPFKIIPVDRPKITSMLLTAQGPRETEPKKFDFKTTDSAVRLAPQTKAKFEFETNVECSAIKVETSSPGLDRFTNSGTNKHAVEWVHDAAVSLRIVLVSQESGLESHPQTVSIGELPDRAPRLSLRHSGVRLRVTPEATIPLTISARDDFGIRTLSLDLSTPQATIVKPVDEEGLEPRAEGRGPEKGEPAQTEGKDGEKTDREKTDREKTEAAAQPEGTPAPDAKPADTPMPTTPAEETTTPDGPMGPSHEGKDEGPGTMDPAADPQPSTLNSQPASPPPAPQPVSLFGPADPANQINVDHEHKLELTALKLEVGRTLVIAGVAEDDCILGRQSTRSAPLVFRIVKSEELFKEILQRQQQLRARLSKARDLADEQATKLPFVVDAESARLISRQHQVIAREVGQVAQGLDATVLEMQLNKLGGEEAWDLIATLIVKPLQTMTEIDLPAQRASLEELVRTPTEGLDEITAQQKKIVEDLDKILKNMAQWDSFIDIVNQVDYLKKIETGVLNQTEALKKSTQEEKKDDPKGEKKKEADSIFDN
jgi:hypothetical protein